MGSKISFSLAFGQCSDKGYQTGRVIFMDKCLHRDKQCDGNGDTGKNHPLVTLDNVSDILV